LKRFNNVFPRAVYTSFFSHMRKLFKTGVTPLVTSRDPTKSVMEKVVFESRENWLN